MPEKDDLYAIYQVKSGDEYLDYRFESIDGLGRAGLSPDPAHYEHSYTGALPAVDRGRMLEHLYERFNLDHPADFMGHSLSVSDVVVLRQDGKESAHFVDSVGFYTLVGFVEELDMPQHLPKFDPMIQPVVTIVSSEESRLHNGAQIPLPEADPMFRRLDEIYLAEPWYNKVRFQLDYTFNGEARTYIGRQDLGDGDGGLIDHIQKSAAFCLGDESWQQHLAKAGSLSHAAANTGYKDVLEVLVPYLRLHCELAEMWQSAIDGMKELKRLNEPTAANLRRAAFYRAHISFVDACRKGLNSSADIPVLPEAPRLEDFLRDPKTKAYEGKVLAELRAEARDAGMTLDEYAANGYEARKSEPFENYLLNTELSTEQNYNLIDGIINNLPPEASAAGSLTELLKEKQQEAAGREPQPDDAARQKKPHERERE